MNLIKSRHKFPKMDINIIATVQKFCCPSISIVMLGYKNWWPSILLARFMYVHLDGLASAWLIRPLNAIETEN
jgi:hypothetical protein